MATKIIHKKSSVAEKVPLTTDLEVGELAINLVDKKLFSKDGNGNIIEFGSVEVQQLTVYNGTGATITKGSVVYINGAQGQRPSIALASNSSEATSSKTIGFVVADILNGAEGTVTTEGLVYNLNTLGLTEGGPVYLGSTAGSITQTKPVAPAHLVSLGWVVKANASSGRILAHVQNGFELNEIHDVLISSPTNGQVLAYETSSGLWKNTTSQSTASSYATGKVTLSTTTADQIIDSFLVTAVKTTKYYVEATTASSYHATEILLIQDGTACYVTEYATIYSGSSLISFNANISGGNVRLLATPVNTNTTVTFARIDVLEGGAVGGTIPTASTTVLGGVKVDGTTIAISNGIISSVGGGGSSSFSNQYSLTGTTTNSTETELLIDGLTRIPVATNKAISYLVTIAARRTDTPGDYAMFELKGVAANSSGVVTDVGSAYEIIVARTNTGYLVDARADDTNNSINIYVTGVTGHTISWKASVQVIEV
jgi:hypothetical protein